MEARCAKCRTVWTGQLPDLEAEEERDKRNFYGIAHAKLSFDKKDFQSIKLRRMIRPSRNGIIPVDPMNGPLVPDLTSLGTAGARSLQAGRDQPDGAGKKADLRPQDQLAVSTCPKAFFPTYPRCSQATTGPDYRLLLGGGAAGSHRRASGSEDQSLLLGSRINQERPGRR